MPDWPAFVDELLPLFVQHLEQGPDQTAAYRAIADRYPGSMEFLQWRNSLDRYRNIVRQRVGRPPRDQITEMLQMVRVVDPSTRPVLARFVADALGPAWSDAQRQHFSRLASLFVAGHDYFLSFTGRSMAQRPGVVLRVNREYEAFIARIFAPQRIAAADRTEDNLLAEAVNAVLDQKGLRGFCYTERRGDSAPVLQKLDQGCRDSLCFVQLLANEMMLALPPTATNYCLWEYELATRLELPQLFLLSHGKRDALPQKLDVDPGLWGWYERVAEVVDLRLLPAAPVTDAALLEQIELRIQETADQIVKIRRLAIANVPP